MTPPTRNPESLRYYATSGPFSDLGAHAARVRDLPEALPELCRVVQGLVVHPFLSRLYGLEPDTLHWDDLQYAANDLAGGFNTFHSGLHAQDLLAFFKNLESDPEVQKVLGQGLGIYSTVVLKTLAYFGSYLFRRALCLGDPDDRLLEMATAD